MASQLDIVSQLQNYNRKKATGAFFVKLTNGKLLQTFFERGELQSVKYNGSAGLDAIKHISSLTAVKSQFHSGALSKIVNDLPPFADIIHMINDDSFGAGAAGRQSAGYISSEEKEIIENVFIEYVGPIGDFIFSEELTQSSSAGDLIERLSQQLDDLEERSKFKKQTLSAING